MPDIDIINLIKMIVIASVLISVLKINRWIAADLILLGVLVYVIPNNILLGIAEFIIIFNILLIIRFIKFM